MPEAIATEKALRADLARLTAELAESRQENKLLQEKINALIKRIFGAASEPSEAR
jgi:vacuolar-type H+-ATPase subunit D/Vma8